MRSVHPHKTDQAQKRLFRDAFQQRGWIAALLLISVISAAVILLQMYSLSVLIDAAFLREWSANTYQPVILVLTGTILARSLLVWMEQWLGMNMAIRLKAAYRKRLLYKIDELGPVRLKDEKTGELIGLQLNGIEKLDDFFRLYVPSAIRMAVIPVIIILVAMWVDWPSGLVFMITGPLIPLFMYLIGTRAGDKIREKWNSFRRMNAHFLDTIQGMDTLKLYGREKYADRSIRNVSRMFRVTTLRVLRIAFLSGMVLELAASVSTAVVAVEIGVRLIEGMVGFQIGMFVLLLAPEFYLPFRNFGSSHHAGMEGAESGAGLFRVLDDSPTQNVQDEQGNGRVPDAPFTIHVHNLRYRYPGTERDILNGLSLTLKPGEVHTVTGASGEGKTTLLNLLGRVMEAQEGEVRISGQPLSGLSAQAWRDRVAYLPQFPHFFPGTIASNIRMGDSNATVRDLIEAAEMALAHSFISELPEGYETVMGEDGLTVSGGERRRIALARAFLRDAPVLLLDEPGSFLNENLEEELIRSLKRLGKHRIILLASHQPITILGSDRLSVIQNGAIVESGSPDDLFPLYEGIPGRNRGSA